MPPKSNGKCHLYWAKITSNNHEYYLDGLFFTNGSRVYYSALESIYVLKRLQYGHHQKSSQIDMLRSFVTHVQIRIWIMIPLKTAWLFKVLFSIQASAFCNQFIITRGWDFPGWRTSSVSIYVFHFSFYWWNGITKLITN